VAAGSPQPLARRTALLLNQSTTGQAVAVALEGVDGQAAAVDKSL